ncbi:glycosyltransferase family 4 protein [Metallibacterium sp.]
MKIGIDASRLRAGSTGVGRYTEGILGPLDSILPDADFVLFAKRDCNVMLPSHRWSIICDTHPVWSRLPTMIWIRYRLGSLMRSKRVDVFWATNTLAPRRTADKLPYVTTVLDFRHVIYPKDMPPITRIAHQMWFDSSVRGANYVVAISDGTSERMRTIIGQPADAVARPAASSLPTIANQANAKSALAALGIQQPFLITVGRSPCKNIASAVRAVDMMKARGQLAGFQLVMVGAENWGSHKRFNKSSGKSDWIKPIGRVDDITLSALYSHSEALLFPSFYEGFGMPVFEARAMGCRVVATDSPELREAGGEDATYVQPTPEGIAAGLEMALSLSRPNPASSLGHDWVDAAKIMAGLLQSAAAKAKRR